MTPVIVALGGSGGIGVALAEKFAVAFKMPVVLVGRDASRLQGAREKLLRAIEVPVHCVARDLNEAGAPLQFFDWLQSQNMYCEILLNCLGSATGGDFLTLETSDIAEMIDTNIRLSTEVTRLAASDMKRRRRGGILSVASIAGLMPIPSLAVYSASKAYLVSLSRALAVELRPYNVKLSVLTPGPVDTGFLNREGFGLVRILPRLSPDSVAAVGLEGYTAGQSVITPGMLGLLQRLGIKLIPHSVLLSVLGWMGRKSRHETARYG